MTLIIGRFLFFIDLWVQRTKQKEKLHFLQKVQSGQAFPRLTLFQNFHSWNNFGFQ